MIRKVQCAEGVVEYELFRKNVKNMNLRVERNGKVRVSSPKSLPPERADDFVMRNAKFIFKTQEHFAAQPKRESGVVYYFGKRYEYAVREGERDRVLMENDQLIVETTQPNDEAYEKMILSVYEEEMCRRLFPEVVRKMLPLVEPFGVKMPKVTPRRMTTRWGSCTPAACSIRLNTRLIHYPLRCIEQVALHELCHFVQPNHSVNFYAMMTRLMPDWRAGKKELDEGMYDRLE